MYEIGLDLQESSCIHSAGDSKAIELLHSGYSGGDGFRRGGVPEPEHRQEEDTHTAGAMPEREWIVTLAHMQLSYNTSLSL